MTPRTYDFRFDPAARLLRAAMIGPGTAFVRVTDDELDVRFGPWRCRTPLRNVKDVTITRDYAAHRAIGARGSLADLGATFGTATHGGVCICFHERVAALTPMPVHPALTVTVDDLDGLAEDLRRRCDLPSPNAGP